MNFNTLKDKVSASLDTIIENDMNYKSIQYHNKYYSPKCSHFNREFLESQNWNAILYDWEIETDYDDITVSLDSYHSRRYIKNNKRYSVCGRLQNGNLWGTSYIKKMEFKVSNKVHYILVTTESNHKYQLPLDCMRHKEYEITFNVCHDYIYNPKYDFVLRGWEFRQNKHKTFIMGKNADDRSRCTIVNKDNCHNINTITIFNNKLFCRTNIGNLYSLYFSNMGHNNYLMF